MPSVALLLSVNEIYIRLPTSYQVHFGDWGKASVPSLGTNSTHRFGVGPAVLVFLLQETFKPALVLAGSHVSREAGREMRGAVAGQR